MPFKDYVNELESILRMSSVPEAEELSLFLKRARYSLNTEGGERRPFDGKGRPGGLIFLDPDLPTLLVPDLHGRMDFFLSVMTRHFDGTTAAELLNAGGLQIVCLGDGFHGEARAAGRWFAAYDEFRQGFESHGNMDREMRESLGLMQMVMLTKHAFPGVFHFLKGNHENILNEYGEGNYPFGKFVYEGEMVFTYMKKFYPPELLKEYSGFEKTLPLLAVGGNFLASHAEPKEYYPKEAVIGYREDPEVVYGLTWTDNGAAHPGSVERMLAEYLPEKQGEGCYYFGGHRPVHGTYALRAEGRYIQIHNPQRRIVAYLPPEKPIDPKRDIFEITG